MGKVAQALERGMPPNRGAGLPGPAAGASRGPLGWDERLLTVLQTPAVVESIRRLRGRILHPDDGRKPCRSLLVTGAEPGEGKSFLCANLGISLAQGLEQHALLVDCDLRRCALAALFGLRRQRGLADFLRDGAALEPLLCNSGMAKLTLLPSGKAPANPAELLGSERMALLVAELRGRYADRLVLFDTPPNQAASETAVLAKQVDGVILVVRWGCTGREQVKQLVEAVGREKVVALVFNGYEHNAASGMGLGKDYYREYK